MHMTGQHEWLLEFKLINVNMKMNNVHIVQSAGTGKMLLTVKNKESNNAGVTLQDMLLIPKLSANLFSITCAVVHGGSTIIYDDKRAYIKLKRADKIKH